VHDRARRNAALGHAHAPGSNCVPARVSLQ
jgi:hypothetical protein